MKDEAKRERVIELRNNGMTYNEIAKAMNMKNSSWVCQVCRGSGCGGTDSWKLKKHEAMREYKAQGHTHKEVADKFGISEAYSQVVCKGIAPQKDRPQEYRNAYSGIDKDVLGRKLVEERAPDFDYVGGYTTSDGFVDIRCKACGVVLHKSCVTIRHRKTSCENCKRIVAEKAKQEKEQQLKIQADKRELARIGKKRVKQLSFSICKGCGCLFYSERIGVSYCSDSCVKRVHNAIAKDKRLKKLSNRIIDKGITLKRLFEKSEGVCALCGGRCSWGDHYMTDNGAFVAGATYPSIDHIIPISKGGLHEWSNIQLAHFYCNTLKGNNTTPPV